MKIMKYVFVIPTLNRAEVLPWSVNSILEQQGNHNVEILISNNKSDDNTKDIVSSFDDPRIRYIEPPSRLSMSKHWEFAMQFVELEDSVVSILGDDDIISSNAINIVDSILENSSIEAVSRKTGYYTTLDCDSEYAGWITLPPIDGFVRVKNSRAVLKEVAKSSVHYGELPTLYHGFVRGSLLKRLLTFGPLFNKASPDIYSDIALGCLGINYAQAEYPLTLGVASPKSTGLNAKKNTVIGNQFFDASSKELFHKYFLKSVMFQVLDSLEDVFEKQGVNFPISYDSYYRMILAEIPQNSLAEAMESLKMIASKSSTQINFDYAIISLYKSLKNSIKNIVYGYKIIKNQFHLSLNKKESFMFFGNVLESNKVSSPQQCIKFLQDNIQYRGIIEAP